MSLDLHWQQVKTILGLRLPTTSRIYAIAVDLENPDGSTHRRYVSSGIVDGRLNYSALKDLAIADLWAVVYDAENMIKLLGIRPGEAIYGDDSEKLPVGIITNVEAVQIEATYQEVKK
nr:MAG TPA: hypothetical protein [Caudoviricetes sp.]